ncbi:MAG: AzlD domain-containing protein [Salinarimonadaceae bacterium]|nr:MAG: AzlD domain-containing protein [Salinarimonadaceae bacterium]
MTAFDIALAPLWPYLMLILVGFLPSEIWRALAVLLARGLREDSEVITWVRAVATTLLAGVVVKLLASPSGALVLAPAIIRFGAVAVGVLAFFAMRRSVVAGVLAGECALIAGAYMALSE